MLDILKPLITDVLSVVNEHEETVVAGQSIHARKCVADLHCWAKNLSEHAADAKKSYRKLLTIVCLHKRRLQAARETYLVKLIDDKILQNREAINRDTLERIENYRIPDHEKADCDVHLLNDLKSANEVKQIEADAFAAALRKLHDQQNQFNKDGMLYLLTKLFSENIEAEFNRTLRLHNSSFDVKYHTNLLVAAAAYLKNPDDNHLAKFSALLNRKEASQASYAQKRRAIGMMIVGAVIAAAGVAFGVLSLGIVSPVTLLAVSFGLFVLSAGYLSAVNARQKNLSMFGRDIIDVTNRNAAHGAEIKVAHLWGSRR